MGSCPVAASLQQAAGGDGEPVPICARPGLDPAPGQAAKHSLAEGTEQAVKSMLWAVWGLQTRLDNPLWLLCCYGRDTLSVISTPPRSSQHRTLWDRDTHPASGWLWGGSPALLCLSSLLTDG